MFPWDPPGDGTCRYNATVVEWSTIEVLDLPPLRDFSYTTHRKPTMKPSDITPEFVRAVWAHLQDAHGSRVRPKAEAPLMKIAARITARRTTMTQESFMTKAVTTLGRRIFVPFKIGEPTPEFDLEAQLLLGPHEHTHVVQWQKQPLRFWTRYARDTRKRALYEAEGFVTEFEASNTFGLLPRWTPAQRVNTLRSYGVDELDMDAALEYVLAHTDGNGVPRGAAVTPVGKELVKWFGFKYADGTAEREWGYGA